MDLFFHVIIYIPFLIHEKFENTKLVIRSRKSKKNSDQKKKDKQ